MLNIVLGAGLLTLPGLAFREAGHAAIWIWVGCAVVAIPLLVVFTLIGRQFQDAGGIPAVMGQQFGQRGYTAGTFLFLGAVSLGLPGIAVTGGYYAASLVDLSPYTLGAILLVAATAVNFLSAEIAGRVNSVIASALVIILFAVVVFGAMSVADKDVVSQAPLTDLPDLSLSQYSAVFMMIFFAFTGWEVASHLSEEFHNPKRDIPIAMMGSFLIALFFYLGLALIVALSGLTHSLEAPFVAILAGSYGPFAGQGMAIVAVVMIFANLSAAIWAVSRMVYSSAREGLLPAAFCKTSNGTPVRSVFAVLCVLLIATAAAGSGLLPLNKLLEFAGQNFLLLYGCAAIALLSASNSAVAKTISLIAIAIVIAVLAMRDMSAMLYPAALILCSLLASTYAKPAPE
jgi:amino acid efflux transporter